MKRATAGTGKSLIQVLVVDDFEPFRQFVLSTLHNKPNFRVIAEAADGSEAVQKASELQPDVIVLDIGLPKLSGLDAARQIRELSPKSKILFVSQETSADVVHEAISLGASGYLVKTDAGSELLPGLDAVLRGVRFVGSRFAGYDFTGAFDEQGPQAGFRITAGSYKKAEIGRRHEVGFYSDDASLLDGFTDFIFGSLIRGSAVVVVAIESHLEAVFARLEAKGLDISRAVKQGRYIALSVTETLSFFMDNGLPDPVRFRKAAGDLIDRAEKAGTTGKRVAACGECAPLLCSQGNLDATLLVEQLWDEVAKKRDVDILCGYSLSDFQGEQGRRNLHQISEQHSAVHSW